MKLTIICPSCSETIEIHVVNNEIVQVNSVLDNVSQDEVVSLLKEQGIELG